MSSWWIDIALCTGLAALACLMIRMRQDLRRSAAHISQVMESLTPGEAGQGEEAPAGWPPQAVLQANSPAPSELVSRTNGRWALAVFGRDAAQIEAVLPHGADLDLLRSRYSLVAATPLGKAAETDGEVDLVPVPERTLDGMPLPSAAMIAPDGLIQGMGSIANDFDLLAFVHEGEHHGFGPDAVTRHDHVHA